MSRSANHEGEPPHPRETQKCVAVIGCGYWGKNHVRSFSEFGALKAVHDQDLSVAASFADRHDATAASFEDILSDSSISSVVIATPAEHHHDQARQALLAGKHVLVEKPLALKCGQAEELCRLADDSGLVLMVGHILHYHPAFGRLKEMVAAGQLGRLQYMYSNRLNLGRIRQEENILWSFAPHDVSMILSLIGKEPDMVTAAGSYYLHKAVADVTVTNLRFPGGENAHIFVSWLHPFKEQKLVVVGDKAMVVFDDVQPWAEKLTLYPHRISWRNGLPSPEKADGIAVPVGEDEPLKRECQHFLDCVANGARPQTDGREGLRVLRVLDAAERSMTSGRPVACGRSASTEATGGPDAMVHESAFVDDGVKIGSGTRIWHFCHLLSGTEIGRDVSIGQNVMIGPDVTVGDNCKIQNNVSLYKGVTLEDGVFCGPSCVFTNVHNPRADVNRKDAFRETVVRRGATIGANATIVCGNEIGAYSTIGAGAVVTKAVPPFALMAGVPARRIGWVSHAGEVLDKDLVCPRTGRRYREAGPDRLVEAAEP